MNRDEEDYKKIISEIIANLEAFKNNSKLGMDSYRAFWNNYIAPFSQQTGNMLAALKGGAAKDPVAKKLLHLFEEYADLVVKIFNESQSLLKKSREDLIKQVPSLKEKLLDADIIAFKKGAVINWYLWRSKLSQETYNRYYKMGFK